MKQQKSEEEIKKELIRIRHSKKNEPERQFVRKNISPSSRFLDNYFNPSLYSNAWMPNGKVIEKKKYNHGETGLSHYFEKNFVLQKMDIQNKKDNKNVKITRFLEYEYMEEGDMIITIEHCSNCEEHQTHTQHINDIYKKIAKILQKCILLRYPLIKVYLKPIETDIISGGGDGSLKKTKSNIIEDRYKEVKIGAMELQLAVKKSGNLDITSLHSKLSSGAWPSVTNVLNKIVKFMPMQNLSIKVFDKEEGLQQEEEEKSDDLLFSKYENIKVNVFLLNNPQIQELSEIAGYELESILNPKKRKLFLSEMKQMERELYGSGTGLTGTAGNSTLNALNQTQSNSRIMSSRMRSGRSGSPGVNTNNTTRNDSLPRPFTGRSSYTLMSSRISSANRLRPISTGSNFYQTNFNSNSSALSNTLINNHQNLHEIFDDKEKVNKLKGMLIKSSFTDKKGVLSFDNLPFDSYLIEIEDSKNFLCCASIVKFTQMKQNEKTQKFYGLRRQTHSYVEIYIYQENEEMNLQLITGSEVVLRRCHENIVDNTFFDDESKLNIVENKKIKGRHEILTIPGRYILEVNKKGFDYVRKEIELHSGENKVNVELNKEKKFKICVSVFEYFSKSPVENVNLKMSYSKSDLSEEGLTDNSGVFVLETVKNDDFITIFAVKDGYFPCQRTFVKDLPEPKVTSKVEKKESKTQIEKTWKVSNTEEIEKDVIIFIVKESLVFEQKSFVLILYSNLFEENFDFCLMHSDEVSSILEFKAENNQRSKGMMSIQIEKKNNFDEFDFNRDVEKEEYPEIMRLMLKIKNPALLKKYEINNRLTINGLQKFSCEGCLYAPNGNIFFIQSPQFSREDEYFYWDLGFLDIRSDIFYEIGLLIKNPIEKNLFFNDWLHFLQMIIDKKIYTNLFEYLHFNKGMLSQNDRLMYEPAFIRAVKQIFTSEEVEGSKENLKDNSLTIDFMIYLCDLMKNNYKMVSFSILKKKLASNLKNFRFNLA